MRLMALSVLMVFGGVNGFEFGPQTKPKTASSVSASSCHVAQSVDYPDSSWNYQELVKLPAILGVDISSVIEAVGGVTTFKVSDEVYYSP